MSGLITILNPRGSGGGDPLSAVPFILRLQSHIGGIATGTIISDKIASINDLATGFTFAQATAANRPAVVTDDGFPAWSFDGINDELPTAHVYADTVKYVVAVFKKSISPILFALAAGAGVDRILTSYPATDGIVYSGDTHDIGYPFEWIRVNGEYDDVLATGHNVVTLKASSGAVALTGTLSIGASVGFGSLNTNVVGVFLLPDTATYDQVLRVEQYAARLSNIPEPTTAVDGFYTETTGTFGGDDYRLYTPTTRNGGLIVYYHGAGQGLSAFNNANAKRRMLILSAIREGWTVLYPKLDPDSWGNQTGINLGAAHAANIHALYTDLNRTVLLGESMGGAGSLNTIRQGAIPDVKGWYGIDPVCDVQWMFDNGWSAQINAAYGGSWTTNGAGFNPVAGIAGPFAGIRMRFVASDADTIVNKAANSGAMRTLVAGVATESGLFTATENHSARDHYPSADFVSFLGRCN